jgi:hypothetical protein
MEAMKKNYVEFNIVELIGQEAKGVVTIHKF